MRLRAEHISSIIGILVIVTIYFLIIRTINQEIMLSPEELLFSPQIPSDCSQSEMIGIWESIFEISSSGMEFVYYDSNNPGCDRYIAFKNISDKIYLLFGLNENYTSSYGYGQSIIEGIVVKSLEGLNETIKESFNETVNDELTFMFSLVLLMLPNNETDEKRTSELVSPDSALAEFNSLFKISSINLELNNWEEISLDAEGGYKAYTFKTNETYTDTEYNVKRIRGYSGIVIENFSKSIFLYADALNRTASEEKGILGNISISNIKNITIKIDGKTLNNSRDYSMDGEKRFEIYEENKLLVSFEFNLTEKLLDLRDITIKKQNLSSNIGYLIVNGIDEEKTFYIDRIDNLSNQICVKDSEISSINSISSGCSASNEKIVKCPGTNSSISCTISSSGNKFIVSGLTNSAVKEYLSSLPDDDCEPNWDCSSWSICSNNLQTRTCPDINNCSSSIGRPNITQSCSSTPTTCTQRWNCTTWEPEKCPKNETQTKRCTDLNNCGDISNKPDESKTCQYEPNYNWIVITIIIVLIFFILLIILLILYIINRKQNVEIQPE